MKDQWGSSRMGQLELKHISPYLPYQLRCRFNTDDVYTIMGLINENVWLKEMTYAADLFECKPILRPMSDLEDSSKNYLDLLNEVGQTIEYNGGSFFDGVASFDDPCWLPYASFEFLLENHFDVFGLIDQGLAIDINTVEEAKS